MIKKVLSNIGLSALMDKEELLVHQNKLLKCLICIYDLVFICEDTSNLKIQHIFPEILEYATSIEHIINLYAITSILFFCKSAHQTDFEMYPKILFHATPFMRLFDLHQMDIAKVYQRIEQSKPSSTCLLSEDFLKIAKHGKDILRYFDAFPSMEIETEDSHKKHINLPPKIIAAELIKDTDLNIEVGSYDYYNLLGEILLGSFIHEKRGEDILSVLTAMQSFCGKLFH